MANEQTEYLSRLIKICRYVVSKIRLTTRVAPWIESPIRWRSEQIQIRNSKCWNLSEYKTDPGRFTPFVVYPRTVHPFIHFFFIPTDDSPPGWFTPPTVSPRTFHPQTFHTPESSPPECLPPGMFTPRNVHPPECSSPKCSPPRNISHKTNKISG